MRSGRCTCTGGSGDCDDVDFPPWRVDSLDAEATRLGVTLQSVIKMWLAERLDEAGYSPANR